MQQGEEGGNLNFMGQVVQFFWKNGGAKNLIWMFVMAGILTLFAIKIFGPTSEIAQTLGCMFIFVEALLIVCLCVLSFINPAFFYDSQTWQKHEENYLGDKLKGLIEVGTEVTSTQPLVPGQTETLGKDHDKDRKELKG